VLLTRNWTHQRNRSALYTNDKLLLWIFCILLSPRKLLWFLLIYKRAWLSEPIKNCYIWLNLTNTSHVFCKGRCRPIYNEMGVLEIFANIIINAGIAQGFLIAFLYKDQNRPLAHFLLSLLSLDLSLIVFRIHYLNQIMYDTLGAIFLPSGPFQFLLGPFLFFYLRNVVYPESTITRKDSIHFAFFAVFFVLSIPVYFYGKESIYFYYLQRIIGSPWIFLVVQTGYYLIQTRRLLRIHKNNIVEKFSNVEGMDVSWLNLVFWIFILIFFFMSTYRWFEHP